MKIVKYIIWHFMEIHGIDKTVKRYNEIPRNFMKITWIPCASTKFYGITWVSMELGGVAYGMPWFSVKSPWKSG